MIRSQNFRHPSVLAVIQTVTAAPIVVVVFIFFLILLLLFFVARRRGRPQGSHQSTDEISIKNSTVCIRLGLHDELTPADKTNVSVFSLHDRHSSVQGIPTAVAAAMGAQTLLQIRQILRIWKKNVISESEQFTKTLSLCWQRRQQRKRPQMELQKLRRVVVLMHQFLAGS